MVRYILFTIRSQNTHHERVNLYEVVRNSIKNLMFKFAPLMVRAECSGVYRAMSPMQSMGKAIHIKTKNLAISFLAISFICSALAQQADPSLAAELKAVQENTNAALQSIKQQLANLFKNYPTNSINELAIEQLYGPAGLNLESDIRTHVKQFYFYLEYLARAEKAARLLARAIELHLDYLTIISEKGWQGLMQAVGTPKVLPEPHWVALSNALRATFTKELKKEQQTLEDLPKTSFWQAVTITQQEIAQSIFWQEYLKFAVRATVELDTQLVTARFENEKQIFKYLPNLEISYFHPDFAQLHASSSLATISLIINDRLRTRMITQSTTWIVFKDGPADVLIREISEFEQSEFYKTAIKILSADKKEILSIRSEPPYGMFGSLILMINLLQPFIHQLFSKERATKSFEALARIAQQPMPALFFYQTDDAAFIQQLTDAQDDLKRAVLLQEGVHAPDDDLVYPQGIIDWINERAQNFWSTLKRPFEATYATAKQFVQASIDNAKVFYYSSGVAELIQHIPRNEAQQLARFYKDALSKDVQQMQEDIADLLKGLINIQAWPGRTLVNGVLTGLGQLLKDPALAKNADAIFDAVVNTVVNAASVVIAAGPTVFVTGLKLTADAISLLTHVVVDIVSARDPRSALISGFREIAYDLVSSLMEGLSFALTKAKESIVNLIQAMGYLIKFITDVIVDTAAGVWAFMNIPVSDLFAGGLEQAYLQTRASVAQHRRLIAQLTTVALMVGITVGTGGLGGFAAGGLAALGAAGTLAFDLGFGGTAIASGIQEDIAVQEAVQEQHAFVETYKLWTDNKQRFAQAQQQAVTQELNKKIGVELSNYERSLAFYQEYLNGTFTAITDQERAILGAYQAQLLTPDPTTKVVYADLGAIYGHTTGWYNLNPSQGFAIYSPARETFSQEVAEYPSTIIEAGGAKERFWFTQKAIRPLAKDPRSPLSVEVRLRPIYVLDSFALGLYLGGKALNVQNIITTKQAELDPDYLAKMIVFLKESKNTQPSVALYEHEGAGWLTKSIPGPEFILGVWYRFKVELDATTLRYKIWQEGEQEPGWQSQLVQPTDQQTIGILFSGASVEWQTVTPADTISPLPALYKPYTGSREEQRECTAQEIIQTVVAPSFGSAHLEAIQLFEILKGNYIYTTEFTHIAAETNKTIERDFVVFAHQDAQKPMMLIDLGMAPSPDEKAVLVSLISGKVFDTQAKVRTHVQAALETYTKEHPMVGTELIKAIEEARLRYAQTLRGPFTFGVFTLTPTSMEDIQAQHFIYQTTTPQSTPDYVLMAQLDSQNNIIASGMPFNADIPGMVSLVTGLVFRAQSTEAVNSGYLNQLAAYEKIYGSIRPALKEMIEKERQKYQATMQPSEQEKIGPVTELAQAQSKKTESPATTIPPKLDEMTKVTFGPPSPPAQSLTQRQQEASKEEEVWW